MYYFKHTFKILILLLTGSLFFITCSEDSTGPNNNSIVGTWELTKMKMEGNGFVFEVTADELDFSLILEIHSDGTYTTTEIDQDGTSSATGEWSTKGNQLIIHEEGEVINCTYNCSSTKLTICFEEEDDEGETIILTQEFKRIDTIIDNQATINGTLSLPQPAPGKTYIVMIDNDFDGDNGQVRYKQGLCGSGSQVSYQIENVPTGTYFVYAAVFVVSDGSQGPQSGDYLGIYGGDFPNSVPANPNANVTAGTNTFNINLGIFP